jgi:hypothetical protein
VGFRASQSAGRVEGGIPQPAPLAIQPVLDIRRPRYVEPFQKVAAVVVEGFGGRSPFQILPERYGVTPELRRRDTHFLLAPSDQHGLPEGPAKEMKRPPERAAGVFRIQLGPEEAEQGVAPDIAARCGDGEIGEEGESLGLLDDCAELGTPRDAQIHRSQRAELEHLEE